MSSSSRDWRRVPSTPAHLHCAALAARRAPGWKQCSTCVSANALRMRLLRLPSRAHAPSPRCRTAGCSSSSPSTYSMPRSRGSTCLATPSAAPASRSITTRSCRWDLALQVGSCAAAVGVLHAELQHSQRTAVSQLVIPAWLLLLLPCHPLPPLLRSTWAPASRAPAAAAQEEGAAEAEGDGHQRQGRYGGRAAAAFQRHWQDGGLQGLRRRHGLLRMPPPLPTPRSCAAHCVVCLLPTLLFLPKPALLISPCSLLPLLRSAVAFWCTLVPEL